MYQIALSLERFSVSRYFPQIKFIPTKTPISRKQYVGKKKERKRETESLLRGYKFIYMQILCIKYLRESTPFKTKPSQI